MTQTSERKNEQTVDQRRATHAWKAVQEAKKFDGAKAKEYGDHAKKLPSRITGSGLGAALAFVLAKAGPPDSKDHKKHIKQLYDDLTDWVIEQRPIPAKKKDSLLESVIEGDSDFLRRATDEALAYLQWLNRFAEAEGLTEDSSTEG